MMKIIPVSFKSHTIQSSSKSVINEALQELKALEFSAKDVKKVEARGAVLPFQNGAEVYNFLKKNKTKIGFANFGDQQVHALWDFETNSIKINSKYANTNDKGTVLAISSSIMHEAGHAKDKDPYSSVQEELDCLAMNALAHSSFVTKYGNVFQNNITPIVKNGVELYSNLLLKQEADKLLIERLQNTYKNLPAGDFTHPPSRIAFDVKMQNIN